MQHFPGWYFHWDTMHIWHIPKQISIEIKNLTIFQVISNQGYQRKMCYEDDIPCTWFGLIWSRCCCWTTEQFSLRQLCKLQNSRWVHSSLFINPVFFPFYFCPRSPVNAVNSSTMTISRKVSSDDLQKKLVKGMMFGSSGRLVTSTPPPLETGSGGGAKMSGASSFTDARPTMDSNVVAEGDLCCDLELAVTFDL